MLTRTFLLSLSCLMAIGCAGAKGEVTNVSSQSAKSDNPLLNSFDTPFGVPPFNLVENGHFKPAFEVALASHTAEIEAIIAQTEAPSFDNTIAALDYSAELLDRVSSIFFNNHSANTDEEKQAIAREMAPRLTAHADWVSMNPDLFARINVVYNNRADLDLAPEQARLLDETYRDFVRGGALLADEKKARLAEINERLASLQIQFGENLLAENNTFKLVIEDSAELAGLPTNVVQVAKETADKAGLEGQWIFTLHKPSWIPFLQFSEMRHHRETMYKGYISRGNNSDANDNKAVLLETTRLRIERAHLLGFHSHAHYVLDVNMASTPRKVLDFLDQIWAAALPVTQAEVAALQKMIDAEGQGQKLEPWDWWYYTEKLRKEQFDLSEELIKPYFQLKNVQRGAFQVAEKLYGLKFVYRDDLPVYHPDVKTVEVQEADGSHVGILYLDYHPRPGKRQGAWMTSYRIQHQRDGQFITPVIANVFNFTEPTEGMPALLTYEETAVLFHELGHGLHGLLSAATYPGLAGTQVTRDFVELPSQFMENWAVEASVLKTYAVHYQTGEPIPDELITKLEKARHFNQGFTTTEYLGASYLDMAWHTLEVDPGDLDVAAYEKLALDKIGLIPEIAPRYNSTYFAHVFAGGYSSGYYSYLWAAVLDSDAFAAFKEQETLFDPATAQAFRENILSSGNTAEPMELYKKFRGSGPSIQPLLEKRGLAGPAAAQ